LDPKRIDDGIKSAEPSSGEDSPPATNSVTRFGSGIGPFEYACYRGHGMPAGYIPIFIFLVIAILFPVVTLVAAKLIRPSAPSRTKLEAYECGIPAASDSRGRYTVRFYIIAILFVIFDVEAIFLFPWAVRYKQLGWFGVAEVAVFLAYLIVGYVWAYKKGALDWV
jgi:NADH-quinone oxidoreductase subunit A